MAEGAMRALVAWYISPALHMCALYRFYLLCSTYILFF